MNATERYAAGDHLEAWAELVQAEAEGHLGWEVQATQVLHLAMGRFSQNLTTIAKRLGREGYQLGAMPKNPKYWCEPLVDEASAAQRQAAISRLQGLFGSFPLSLHVFYEVVGGASLLGFHSKWPQPQVLDPFCLNPLTGDWLSYHVEHFEEWSENMREDGWPCTLNLSPDNLHKGNISGGAPYGVAFPQRSRLTTTLSLGDAGCMELLQYLRLTCRWGGFLGLAFDPEARPKVPVQRLTEGLLAF